MKIYEATRGNCDLIGKVEASNENHDGRRHPTESRKQCLQYRLLVTSPTPKSFLKSAGLKTKIIEMDPPVIGDPRNTKKQHMLARDLVFKTFTTNCKTN